MHAAERPWTVRPANSMAEVIPAFSGVSTISREPTMLKMMPMRRIFTRPIRSARPPATVVGLHVEARLEPGCARGGPRARIRPLVVMSRDVVLAPARNDTVPIQEVSVQTACH